MDIFSSVEVCENLTQYCFGNGLCNEISANESVCACESYYDIDGNCKYNFFELWDGKDMSHPIVLIVLHMLFIFWVLLEVYIDWKRNTSVWKANFWIAKWSLIVFSICRIFHLSVWMASSIDDVVKIPIIRSIVLNLGSVILFISYLLIIISWIDILKRVKSLKNFKGKWLKFIQRFAFVYCLVFGITSSAVNIMDTFGIGGSIIAALNSGLPGLTVMIVSTYSLYEATATWLYFDKVNKKTSKKDKIMDTINRSLWLIWAIGIQGFLCVIVLVLYVLLDIASSAWPYICFHTALRIQEIILQIFLLFVIENYMTKYSYPGRGYYYGLCGSMAQLNKTSTKTNQIITIPSYMESK